MLGQVYTCNVTAIDFTSNSTFIDGSHLSGNSSDDKQVITFHEYCLHTTNTLPFVPNGLLEFFPNFIGLQMGHCSITTLHGNELEEYSNLQWCGFHNVSVTRVPGNFFASTLNMRLVNFGENEIERVGFGLLDNLKYLERAYILYNVCIDTIRNCRLN